MSIIGSDCVNWLIWVRSQKWTKNGTPLPAILFAKSVSGGPFLILFADLCGRTDGDGRWLLMGQRNVIASRKNWVFQISANRRPGHRRLQEKKASHAAKSQSPSREVVVYFGNSVVTILFSTEGFERSVEFLIDSCRSFKIKKQRKTTILHLIFLNV